MASYENSNVIDNSIKAADVLKASALATCNLQSNERIETINWSQNKETGEGHLNVTKTTRLFGE